MANTCALHATPLRTIMRVLRSHAQAHVFGGTNFGNLVINSPIRQIKIPTKVSRYTVFFLAVRFSAATNSGRLLFKGGVYVIGKLADANHG